MPTRRTGPGLQHQMFTQRDVGCRESIKVRAIAKIGAAGGNAVQPQHTVGPATAQLTLVAFKIVGRKIRVQGFTAGTKIAVVHQLIATKLLSLYRRLWFGRVRFSSFAWCNFEQRVAFQLFSNKSVNFQR